MLTLPVPSTMSPTVTSVPATKRAVAVAPVLVIKLVAGIRKLLAFRCALRGADLVLGQRELDLSAKPPYQPLFRLLVRIGIESRSQHGRIDPDRRGVISDLDRRNARRLPALHPAGSGQL